MSELMFVYMRNMESAECPNVRNVHLAYYNLKVSPAKEEFLTLSIRISLLSFESQAPFILLI